MFIEGLVKHFKKETDDFGEYVIYIPVDKKFNSYKKYIKYVYISENLQEWISGCELNLLSKEEYDNILLPEKTYQRYDNENNPGVYILFCVNDSDLATQAKIKMLLD